MLGISGVKRGWDIIGEAVNGVAVSCCFSVAFSGVAALR